MAGTVPRATYRVQLTPDFGFEEAARIVSYLKLLGGLPVSLLALEG